jgi:hypothetical protein
MEPVGDVTAEIGKVRARALPRSPRDISGLKRLPPYIEAMIDQQNNQAVP